MANKQYDENNKIKNDLPGKQAAVECFTQCFGYELRTPIEKQPELYKAGDVTLYKNGIPILVEVGRRMSWEKSGEWQGFITVRVEDRKVSDEAKYKYYIAVNGPLDTLTFCPYSVIIESGKKVERFVTGNNGERDDEDFYELTTNHFVWFTKHNVENGRWKLINTPCCDYPYAPSWLPKGLVDLNEKDEEIIKNVW
jgi:hypothetical protein